MEESEGEALLSFQLTCPVLQSRDDLVLWNRQKPRSKSWSQHPHSMTSGSEKVRGYSAFLALE